MRRDKERRRKYEQEYEDDEEEEYDDFTLGNFFVLTLSDS